MRVDNMTFSFLGAVVPEIINGTVNITSLTVTPTRTIVTGQAGPMQVNLTFLNPIEVRSHSFVTLNIHIRIILSPKIGSNNPSHSHTWLSPQTRRTAHAMLCRCIQTSLEVRPIVLRSLSSHFSFVLEWSSGDRTKTISWIPSSNADVVFHTVALQTQAKFTEIAGQAEWGTLYYAMLAVS